MASARQVIASLLATMLAGVAAVALAQPHRGSAWPAPGLRVEGFDVEQVPQLTPGTQLNFSLFGTPDAEATLQIDGAQRRLELREVQPGIYEGTYTIEAQDRIGPDGQVTATLRRGHRMARSVLEEPLQLGADVRTERSPPMVTADATERNAPIHSVPRDGTPVPAQPDPPPTPACADCAVVESIRAVDLGARRSHLGAIAGGLFGAILGDQVGRDVDRNLTRLVGALGGALAGHELERRSSRRTRYDVVLRLPDGATHTRSYDRVPPFAVGDTVRLRAEPSARPQRSAAPL